MNIRKKIHSSLGIIVLILLMQNILPAGLQAQDNADLELRGTYTLQKYLTSLNFIFRNDISIRSAFDTNPFTTYMLRPRAILEVGNILDIHPAIDFRYTNNVNTDNSFELRTWQGLNLHWPDIGRVMFDHFYRFEQRFFWSQGEQEDGIGLRSRYRLNMRIPLNKSTMVDKTFFTDIRGEVFIPHDDEIYELYTSRMRFGAILGYRRNSRWRYQLAGYFESGWNTENDSRTVNHYIVDFTVRTNL